MNEPKCKYECRGCVCKVSDVCILLTDNNFKGLCPFYKDYETEKKELKMCAEVLHMSFKNYIEMLEKKNTMPYISYRKYLDK